MKKTKILTPIIMTILLFTSIPLWFNESSVQASGEENYYISFSTGADSNDGSIEAPWQNLSYVNNRFTDDSIDIGDNLYLMRGDNWSIDYSLVPKNGGTSNNPMIIGAYGIGEKPIIYRNDDEKYCMALAEDNMGHIVIENISFEGTSGVDRAIYFYNSPCGNNHNITIRNCNSTDAGCLVTAYCCEYITIENCIVYSNDHHGISIQYDSDGDFQCNNFIIRNCTIIDARDGISIHFGGSDETQSIGNNFWIENCNISCHSTGEEALDIVGGIGCNNIFIQNTIVNDNVIHIGHGTENVTLDNVNCYISGAGSGIYFTSTNNSRIRRCIINGWGNAGLNKGANQYSPDMTQNINIYQNTIIFDGTGDKGHLFIDNDNIYNLVFKNNIFTSISNISPNLFIELTGATSSNFSKTNWSNNLWWRGDGGSGDETWWDDDGGTYTLSQWQSKNYTTGEIRDDPELADISNDDFTLNSSSPCIDMGAWLTQCNGGDTGTTITVDDAGYFFAGFSNIGAYPHENVSGDNIFVGSNTNLLITDINYETEQITVNRSITWLDGDNVSLSNYNGTAPDIGAFEFGSDINVAPIISNPLPANHALDQWINPTLQVTLSDYNGDTMNLTFRTNATGTWTDIGWHNNTNDGSKSNTTNVFTEWDTQYYWSANATDGTDWNNKTYDFRTRANQSTIHSNPYPANSSTNIPITTTIWNITINDPEGDAFNWTIETSPNIGTNNGTYDANGSKDINISGNLSYFITYTVYVNSTDNVSGTTTRGVYTFRTQLGPSTPGGSYSFDIVDYFPLLIILALIMSIVTLMFAGTDPKHLILWAIMFVMAMITIIIITT